MKQSPAPRSFSLPDPDDAGDAAEDIVLCCFEEVMVAASRLAEALHHRLPTHEGHGLGVVALHVLSQSGRRGLSQVELAARLGKSASSATRLVDSLQELKVVSRTPHPNDRRVKMVILTEEGRGVLQSIKIDLRHALTQKDCVSSDPNHFITQIRQVTSLSCAIEHRRKERSGMFG